MTALALVPPLEWVDVIRDPIWTTIPLTIWEKRLLRTRPLQRLQDINQMGVAYVSFPGASHTRLQHSLGTMQAMEVLFQSVDFSKSYGRRLAASKESLRIFHQTLRFIALLHDVGHAPYSHACEEVFVRHPEILDLSEKDISTLPDCLRECVIQKGPAVLSRHETYTSHIVGTDDGIKDVLRRYYREELWPLFRQGRAFSTSSAAVSKREFEDNVRNLLDAIAQLAGGEKVHGDFGGLDAEVCSAFISSDIDVDKLDYLMRDLYNCGARVWLDPGYLRQQVVIERKGLALTDRALPFIEAMIWARHNLVTTIHHETWNQFLTAQLAERISDLLMAPKSARSRSGDRELMAIPLSQRLVLLHTSWTDAQLRHLLEDEEEADELGRRVERRPLRTLLAKEYDLNAGIGKGVVSSIRDDALVHLDIAETHPTLAKIIYVLAHSAVRKRMSGFRQELAKRLGKAFDRDDLVAVFYDAKPLSFDMPLHPSRTRTYSSHTILDDLTIRGVMNESTMCCGVALLGPSLNANAAREMDDAAATYVRQYGICGYSKRMPPCIMGDRDCVLSIEDDKCKLAMALIIVELHRELLKICAKQHVLVPIDFLLIVIRVLTELARREAVTGGPRPYPKAGFVYDVCSESARILRRRGQWAAGGESDLFVEPFPLGGTRPSSRFLQELRTGAYIGVFDCIRQVERVGTGWPAFTRRYRLARGGERILREMEKGAELGVEGFKEVVEGMGRIREVVERVAEAKVKRLCVEEAPHLPRL